MNRRPFLVLVLVLDPVPLSRIDYEDEDEASSSREQWGRGGTRPYQMRVVGTRSTASLRFPAENSFGPLLALRARRAGETPALL